MPRMRGVRVGRADHDRVGLARQVHVVRVAAEALQSRGSSSRRTDWPMANFSVVIGSLMGAGRYYATRAEHRANAPPHPALSPSRGRGYAGTLSPLGRGQGEGVKAAGRYGSPAGADPHDVQPSSLGRLPLASIGGNEWHVEISGGLELESRCDVQRIESSESLPAGQLLGATRAARVGSTSSQCTRSRWKLPVPPAKSVSDRSSASRRRRRAARASTGRMARGGR